MRTYKIDQNLYPEFQQAVDAAFEDQLIKTGRCKHVFPPEMEADEDGDITLHVPQWLLDLERMGELLNSLEEVGP
jgi:hypothetical protein